MTPKVRAWKRQWLAEVVWHDVRFGLHRLCRPCDIAETGRNAWSLCVEPNGSFVNVSFLSPAAPHHLLRPGLKFSLFEGASTLILTGKIIV